MQIEVKLKDDVPYSIAEHIINQMAELALLFGVGEAVVTFDEGEEERLRATQNSRMKQIIKGGIER